MQNDIYSSLNTMQKEAVFHTEGPLLILAGAGSGKTRVLTHRICYLIEEKGISPYHILAITFTNKAAEEMRNRVESLTGLNGGQVWVATFHSTCVRILRRYIDRLGYDNHFTIYDTEDQKTVLRQVIKKLLLDPKKFTERAAMNVISKCKETCMTPQQYREQASDYREQKLAQVYYEYEELMRKNNALDFDDLLVKTVELFEQCPDILESYQHRFRYIHVDEYQDTNMVQFRFVQLLAKAHGNLCVVGDDDQSIYSFRGADIRNILEFEMAFPGAYVVKLEQNYRSTPNILDVANDVIRNNTGRKEKRLWTENSTQEVVRFRQYEDAREEARGVISEIRRLESMGERYMDCAILYRTNAQSRAFEEACIYANIPYRIVGGINFYQRAEIKDLLAYLKTVANGRDDLAVRRIINVPKRGIGNTSLDKVQAYADINGLSFFEALQRAREIPGIGRAADKIHDFVRQIFVFRVKAQELSLDELLESIIEDVNYMDELDKLDEEQAVAKKENIDELIGKAADFENSPEYMEEGEQEDILTAFLEQVALVADIDSVDRDENKVLLMTLHGAKGLEFDHVFLCGMEDGLFPSSMTITSDDSKELEEERRLCYVGITRAKKSLLMTAAKLRMNRGDIQYNKVSRFVYEIADHLLEKSGTIPPRKQYHFEETKSGFGQQMPEKKPAFGKPVPMKKPDSLPYQVGDRVKHDRFGEGIVLAIEDKGRDYAVTVQFDAQEGPKKMMSQFALMEKVI